MTRKGEKMATENQHGDIVFRTAMLVWRWVGSYDSGLWQAHHPAFSGQAALIYEISWEFSEYHLSVAGEPLLSHRDGFESFYAAAVWAESDVLRDMAARSVVDNEPSDPPGFIAQYYRGALACAMMDRAHGGRWSGEVVR